MRIRYALLASLASALLAGCGGGGGSSSAVDASSGTGSTGTGTTGTGTTPTAVTLADATRFLEQSSFGPTPTTIAAVQQNGIAAYLAQQFATAPTGYPTLAYENVSASVGCPTGSPASCVLDNYSQTTLENRFYVNAITGNDQLRQRVALALGQIFVVSGNKESPTYAMEVYQNLLLKDAFVNYRTLLQDVTLSPAMGDYLDMVNNNKPNASNGTEANENYAREVLQLFSLGVNLLNADGSTQNDSSGNPLPTYTQDDVEEFARTFTGWTYAPLSGTAAFYDPPNYQVPMVAIEANHDTTSKALLNGVAVPAGGTAEADLKIALDCIFNHPNVGPFLGRQLIEALVTSNPSPQYISRVSAVFANDGTGTRGNMQAVVQAILTDAEARGDVKTDPSYGKLREPATYIPSLIRMVGGSTDGVFMNYAAEQLEQALFNSGSVFNFYSPDYKVSSTLYGPTFGIYDATSALVRANILAQLLSGPVAVDNNNGGTTGTTMNLAAWEAIAGDAPTLVAQINQVFFHNAMPSDMQAGLIAEVNAITATDTTDRAEAALYLALSSGQYQVEQ